MNERVVKVTNKKHTKVKTLNTAITQSNNKEKQGNRTNMFSRERNVECLEQV